MLLHIGNKRVTILVFVLIIILIILLILGGVFLWENQRGGIKDFSISDTAEGKIIINQKEGLRVMVPNEWKAEKAETISLFQWGINLSSPEFAFDANYNLKKGCMIEVNIEESNLNFELANKRIQSLAEGNKPIFEEYGYEIIEVGQKQAVKELVYDNIDIGIEINVRIPIQKDKNIYLVLRSSFDDKEKCIQEFNSFLQAVDIE